MHLLTSAITVVPIFQAVVQGSQSTYDDLSRMSLPIRRLTNVFNASFASVPFHSTSTISRDLLLEASYMAHFRSSKELECIRSKCHALIRPETEST